MEKNNASNESTPKRRKRQRGGQPDNRNALKHGFYSSFITPAERRKLRKAAGAVGLKHELDLLRVKLGTMASNPNVTISQVAFAAQAIARVAAIDYRISGPQDEQEELAESLKGVLEGIGAAVGFLPRESDQSTDIWAGTFLEDAGDGGSA